MTVAQMREEMSNEEYVQWMGYVGWQGQRRELEEKRAKWRRGM